MRYTCLLIPRRDVDMPFVDDEKQGCIPSSADTLDDCNLLAIAWLNNLWPSASFCACNNID
jgi:hypothetical protein